jgi:hypothetical protein
MLTAFCMEQALLCIQTLLSSIICTPLGMEHMLQACIAHNETDQHFFRSLHADTLLHDLIARNNAKFRVVFRAKGAESCDGEFKET